MRRANFQRMSKRGFLTIVLVLAATLPARGAARVALDGAALVAASRTGIPVSAEIGALGRVSLRLWPNVIHAPGARFTETGADGIHRDVRPEPFWTLAGEVVGAAGSTVRLTVTTKWVSGFVAARGRDIWIEPDDYTHPATTLFTEPRDMTPSGLPSVGDLALRPGHKAASHGGNDVNIYGIGNCAFVACGELEALVILDGDKFFFELGTTTCFARQATTLNNVDAIFRLPSTNIGLTITAQNCRTTADLGPSGTAAVPYLESLRSAWLDAGEDRSIVFLFVGYVIPSGTIGVAYEPGVCERMEPDPLLIIDWDQKCEYGYGLAQMVAKSGSSYTATEFLKTKLVAHEIGHNFSATHASGTGCDTPAKTGDIMCTFLEVSGPNTLSAASAQLIRNHAENTIGYAAQL